MTSAYRGIGTADEEHFIEGLGHWSNAMERLGMSRAELVRGYLRGAGKRADWGLIDPNVAQLTARGMLIRLEAHEQRRGTGMKLTDGDRAFLDGLLDPFDELPDGAWQGACEDAIRECPRFKGRDPYEVWLEWCRP